MANHEAPEGQVYVCGACGRRSRDKYGFKPIDAGWDESCAMNAVLCYAEKKDANDGRGLRWAVVE
jgi:hypothetical protein